MGLKQSSPTASHMSSGYADTSAASSHGYASMTQGGHVSSSSQSSRSRALSLGSFLAATVNTDSSLNFSSNRNGETPPDSEDDYSTDDGELFGTALSSSLPTHLTVYQDIKCPHCHSRIPADSVESHLVCCLTKPHIVYNEDVLTDDKGECCICLDELLRGDTIARLPCLCIYHKGCIDSWFAVNRSCPEHPGD